MQKKRIPSLTGVPVVGTQTRQHHTLSNAHFHLIKEGVASWIEGAEHCAPALDPYPSKFHDRIRIALHNQNAIGWDNALKGYLSVE